MLYCCSPVVFPPSSSQSEYFKLHVSFSCLQSLSCVLQQWRTFLTPLECCQIITLGSLYCCKTKHANGPFIMPLTTRGHNFIKQCHTLYDVSFCITFWITVEDDSVKINKWIVAQLIALHTTKANHLGVKSCSFYSYSNYLYYKCIIAMPSTKISWLQSNQLQNWTE